MKKILSFTLILVIVLSLCTSAFAAGSPTADPTGGSSGGQSSGVAITDEAKVDVEKGTYPVNGTIPSKAVKTVAINKADKALSEADATAFKAAYEEAMAKDDCKVYKCYWMYVDEELAGSDFKGVSKSNALAIKFTCPGKDVKFLVNGKEMLVINEKGSKYIAIVTELGTVTITCAK